MRAVVVYGVLLLAKALSRVLYRHRVEWVDEPPSDLYERLRVAAFLNHTSLYEWLYAGSFPNGGLWRLARDGIIPVADKTLDRPIVGRLFRLIARDVVPVTRRRDVTWETVLRKAGQNSLVVMFPEGRMKRANGLDKNGQPMTVRAGIADILDEVESGYLLLVYSAGLHHVQIPGGGLPRPFKRLHLRLQALDIAAYRAAMHTDDTRGRYRLNVATDLQARRDRHCPPQPR